LKSAKTGVQFATYSVPESAAVIFCPLMLNTTDEIVKLASTLAVAFSCIAVPGAIATVAAEGAVMVT